MYTLVIILVWFWRLTGAEPKFFLYSFAVGVLLHMVLLWEHSFVIGGYLLSGTRQMPRRGNGKVKRPSPRSVRKPAKRRSTVSSTQGPRRRKKGSPSSSVPCLGRTPSGNVIRALKEAVLQELPPPQKMQMSQIRLALQAKTPQERLSKRSKWLQDHPSQPRFQGQTRLGQLAVSPTTALDYQRRTMVFQGFCRIHALRTATSCQVDQALDLFLNAAFEEGLDISEGQKFYAAVLEAYPVVGKFGLVRSKRALKGWQNVDPGQSRTPLAWPFISLVAQTMWSMGQHHTALCILTMFVAYLRPSEALKIRSQDLVQSDKWGKSWALNLNPSETADPSKVGLTDESLLLDSPEVKYLGKALMKIRNLCPNLSLFQISYSNLLNHWKAARLRCSPPATPLRSQLGSHETSQTLAGNKTPREVGLRYQPQALRESCQDCSALREAAKGDQEESRGISRVVVGNGYSIFVPVSPNGRKPALEIFAGSADWSKAMCRQGFTVHAFDLRWGSGGDLLNYNVFHRVLDSIRCKAFCYVHFGMPGDSWSLARKWDGGPPPLRDDFSNLYGFSHLTGCDKQKVLTGNHLLKCTFKLALACFEHGIPGSIENPSTSRAWLTREMRSLVHRGATFQLVHYCQYGKLWKKATIFLTWLSPDVRFRQCAGKHGACSATQQFHVLLQGKNVQGIFKTLIAQPYPVSMVNSIAHTLRASL